MASIDQLKGSDGTGPAALMTIQTLRAALSSTIVVDTVVGVPANFIGTMGTPDTGTGIITDASAVDFRGHVNGANLEIDAISPGFTDIGSQVGDVVVIKPTTDWSDKMVEAFRVSHNDDGSVHATRPQVVTSIDDTNGNEVIKTPATASAVNEITVTNAATGNAPSISASGGDSTAHLNLRGKGLAKTVTIGAGATTIYPYDYVASGCIWTADAAGSTRLASMTAGVVVINGNPITVAAVTGRTFTASKDVYVDVLDNGDGTGVLVYTDGTTNAASPALASNSIRLAIIVVGASNIAAAASVNQGQEDRVLPIASSVPYAVTDSLGNLICPRDPQRRIIGYRRITSDFATTSATPTQVTGLSMPIIIPTGRKIRLTLHSYKMSNSGSPVNSWASIWDGVVNSGTQVAESDGTSGGANYSTTAMASAILTPSSTTKTYNAGLNQNGGNTSTLYAKSTAPAYLMAELV